MDGFDLFGAGKLLERLKILEKSMEFYNEALDSGISSPLAIRIKKKLSYFYKKTQQWEKAIALWEELTYYGEIHPLRELAIYYEHREKNFIKAKEIVEQALDNEHLNEYYKKDFEKRLMRIERRLKKSF